MKKFSQTIILLCCLLASFDQSFAQTDIAEKRALKAAKKAEKSFVKGNFIKSILFYSDALELAPNVGYLYHDRGMAYKANEQPYKAIADFTQVIQSMPNDDESLWQRGKLYLSINQHDRARKDFESYLLSHPDKAQAYAFIAEAYEGKRNYSSGLKVIQKALELEPRSSDYHLHYAKLLLDTDQDEMAKTILFSQTAIDTSSAYYQLIHGYFLLETNDPENAIIQVEKSLQRLKDQEQRAFASYLLANANQLIQNNEMAENHFSQAIDLDREALYYFTRGCFYAENADTAKALLDFNRAINLDKSYTGAYNNRTFYIWFPQKKYEQALADMTRIIEIDSMNAYAYNNRAYAYRGLNQYERAFLDAFHSMELVPRNPYVYKNIALFYDDFDDKEGAKENILKALQLNFPVETDPEFEALLKSYGLEGAY